MTIWKIQLGPGPAPKCMKYRAVVDAATADDAIEAVRQRFPLLRPHGASFQSFDTRELAEPEAAIEYFLANGPGSFFKGSTRQ